MTPLDDAFLCFWVIFLLSTEKIWMTRLLQTWGCCLDSKGKPCPRGHRAVGLAVKPDDHHVAWSKELLGEYASSRVTTHSDIKYSIFLSISRFLNPIQIYNVRSIFFLEAKYSTICLKFVKMINLHYFRSTKLNICRNTSKMDNYLAWMLTIFPENQPNNL